MKEIQIRRTVAILIPLLSLFLYALKKEALAPERVWTKLQTGVTQPAVISFFDDNMGVIAGKDIYLTIDGGSTWAKTFVSSNGKDFLNVDFIDKSNVVAVGVGIIFKSMDGGRTWKSIVPPIANFGMLIFLMPPWGILPKAQASCTRPQTVVPHGQTLLS